MLAFRKNAGPKSPIIQCNIFRVSVGDNSLGMSIVRIFIMTTIIFIYPLLHIKKYIQGILHCLLMIFLFFYFFIFQFFNFFNNAEMLY